MAGLMLLLFSFFPVLLTSLFGFLVFEILGRISNLFYISAATNFLFLLTGIIALTLVLVQLAMRGIRNLSFIGLAFRVASSLIAFYAQ